MIKIDAHKPLTAAKIGNSDSVQVGDWAVAIGSPFGLEATVTAGIISAKERDLQGGPEHQFQRFLQTDAAINPGNSGGPLLAINGDVIGINTAILSGSGGYQGVGFALPINIAANVYNQIIKNGKVTRGAIGVSFAPKQKPELLAVYGAKEGVFVQDVTAWHARREGRYPYRRHHHRDQRQADQGRHRAGQSHLGHADRIAGEDHGAARQEAAGLHGYDRRPAER